MVFNKTQLNEFLGKGVYVIRTATQILYVGKSKNGLRRPFADNHTAASLSLVECDELEFIPCSTMTEATTLELKLIKEHRPKYNIQGVPSIGEAKPRSFFANAGQRIGDHLPESDKERAERYADERLRLY